MDKFDILMELVEQRRQHLPVAYILNNKEFYGRDFYVDQNVLVPRPETELLIDLVIKEVGNRANKALEILDLGTGSGCIAITLAKELGSDCNFTAVDSSGAALEVARKNATRYEVSDRINFIQSDWFESLKGKRFDLIISNPPYVNSELGELSPELKHEPQAALYADEQGLSDVKFLVSKFEEYSKPQAIFLCEIGSEQKVSLEEYCNSLGMEAEFYNDLAGLVRVLRLNTRAV